MKKKKIILSLIIIVIGLILIFEIYFSKPNSNNLSSSTQGGAFVYQDSINNSGTYSLINSTYLINQDIPAGTYTIESKSEGTHIQIITNDESKDVSSLEQGDKITLAETDTAIIITDGEISLH